MYPEITPEFTDFLKVWVIVLTVGGAFFLLLGTVVGWIIWKNTRKFTEKLEKENRIALSEFERTSDEISKIKASLSDVTD